MNDSELDDIASSIYWNCEHGEYEKARHKLRDLMGSDSNQWISVKERLPEEAGKYIVQLNNDDVWVATFVRGYWYAYSTSQDVKYWQPFPDAVKQ